MPTKIVKKAIEHLLPIILHMVNSSISEGSFPDVLKNAVVTPINKNTTLYSEDYGNFRPVSNLIFLSKVLERVMYLQLNI